MKASDIFEIAQEVNQDLGKVAESIIADNSFDIQLVLERSARGGNMSCTPPVFTFLGDKSYSDQLRKAVKHAFWDYLTRRGFKVSLLRSGTTISWASPREAENEKV